MDVQVEDGLASVASLIDHCAVAGLSETLLCRNFGSYDHEVTKQLLVSILSLADARQAISVLWNDQKVLGSDRRDVTESQALVIFKDDVGRDLLPDDLVKNGVLLGNGGLSLLLLIGSFSHLLLSFIFTTN